MNLSNRLLLLAIFLSLAVIAQVAAILCVVCNSEQGTNDCITQPPEPVNCTTHTRYEHCVIITKYDQNDTLIGLLRGCSPAGGVGSCTDGRDIKRAGSKVKMCYSFCNIDGCNGAALLHPVPLIAMVIFTSGFCIINRLRYFTWS